VSDDNETDIS